MTSIAVETDNRYQRADAFVAAILWRCADKGTQAALRSGLGRPVEQCGRMHRYLVPLIPSRMHPSRERAYYGVAALIAGRPRRARDADVAEPAEGPVPDDTRTESSGIRLNLGASLARAVRARALKEDSAESLLHLLTRQSAAMVHPRLPALTRQLLGAGVPIDWAVLLTDLSDWDLYRDQIATRWLQSFYRTLYAAGENPTESEKNR